MWVLVVTILQVQGITVQALNLYRSMNDCFTAREQYMLKAPKPKVNYELVCVHTDLFEEG